MYTMSMQYEWQNDSDRTGEVVELCRAFGGRGMHAGGRAFPLVIGLLMAVCMISQQRACAYPTWCRWYSGPGDPNGSSGTSVYPGPNGGFVVGGWRFQGWWVLRVDSLGDSLWAVGRDWPAGSGINSAVCGILPVTDAAVCAWIVVSSYITDYGDTVGLYIVEVSDDGEIIWSRKIADPPRRIFPHCVTPESDGGFLIAGAFKDTTVADSFYGYAARFDGNGNVIWGRRYPAYGDDRFEGAAHSIYGGYLLVGYTDSPQNSWEGWMVRIDDNGDTLWTRYFSTGGQPIFDCAVSTPDGGFAAGGCAMGPHSCLVKLDTSGNIEWQYAYCPDCAWALCVAPDSGLVFAGQYPIHWEDLLLVKTDASGVQQWTRTYGGSGWDVAYDVRVAPGGGYIAAGEQNSFDYGGIYLVRTDSLGAAAPGAITERPGPRNLPDTRAVTIRPVCTIPGGGEGSISYQLPREGSVEVAVYDVNGRMLKVLVCGRRSAGLHQVSFALPFGSGVNYVRIRTPDGSATTKLVNMKP